MTLSDEDTFRLKQFFTPFYNQDFYETDVWIDSPTTDGVVLYIDAHYGTRSIEKMLCALEHLRDLGLNDEALHDVVNRLGAMWDPTGIDAKGTGVRRTYTGWLTHLIGLLQAALRVRIEAGR